MEYRYFNKIDEYIFNTKWRNSSTAEKRVDVYIIVADLLNHNDNIPIEYGLKLRNSKKIELKKRVARFQNGEELWTKLIHSRTTTDINDIHSIIKTLERSSQTELAQRLKNSTSIVHCYVEKHRQELFINHFYPKEITGLRIQFIRSDDHTNIGNPLYFETICIEHSDSKLLDQNFINYNCEKHDNNTIPMGYPEFLFRQCQNVLSSTTV